MLMYTLFAGLLVCQALGEVIPTEGARRPASQDEIDLQAKLDDLFFGAVSNSEHHFNFSDDYFLEEVKRNFDTALADGSFSIEKDFLIQDPATRVAVEILVDLLYFTPNPQAFYEVGETLAKTVNKEMLSYSLAVVLKQREDLVGYTIPPWYSIFPNYFVPNSLINDIKQAKEGGRDLRVELEEVDCWSVLGEDPGWNSGHQDWLTTWPSWRDPEKYNHTLWLRRGELFYHYHNQLLTRYNLERLSCGILPVDVIQWNESIKEGSRGGLMTSAGHALESRPAGLKPSTSSLYPQIVITEEKLKELVENKEIKARANISVGLESAGLYATIFLSDILYNTSFSLNPSLYGSLYDTSLLLISSLSGQGVASNQMTMLRDPATYSLLTNIRSYMNQHKLQDLPPYTNEELEYPGISIENVEISSLETFYRRKDFELDKEGKYKASVKVLDHKPFTLELRVKAEEPKVAMARVSLALLQDNTTSPEVLEIDRFLVRLGAGENLIKRNSDESTIYITKEVKNEEKQFFSKSVKDCGLEGRLMLPRGPLNMTLVVMLTDFYHAEGVPGLAPHDRHLEAFPLCGGLRFLDQYPMGFPFDRDSTKLDEWQVPNLKFTPVTIHHSNPPDTQKQ